MPLAEGDAASTPDDQDLVAGFWERARPRVEGGHLPLVTGPSATELLVPPAWSFGADPAMADALLRLVLRGEKRATASARGEYDREGEPLPAKGDLSIVLDGSGVPRALVVTTEVRVVPFSAVDAEHAAAEGEGDLSLEFWADAHRRFFSEQGIWAPEMDVVLERFEVLHQE